VDYFCDMKPTPIEKKAVSKTAKTKIAQKQNDLSEINRKQLHNIFQHVPAATAVFEGPEHKYILANKAYQKLFNRQAKDLLGKSMHEVFPELKGTGAFELVDRVFGTGESFTIPEYTFLIDAHHDGVLRQNFYEFSLEPLKNDSGEIYAVVAMIYDITEQVESRKKIEENEKQQTFLLKLSDALRPLSDPVEIEGTATKIALDFMDADRCYYNTLEGGNAIVLRDAYRVGLTSLAGVYPISNFPLFKTVVDAGCPFIVDDVHTSDIIEEGLRQICVQVQVISMINIPVIKSGKPVGVLSLVQSQPRKWTETEVQLTIETAERTWAAIERANVEQCLHTSEEKFRTLFTSIDQGFTLCELIRNKEGKAIDFYILEVNPTYETQTGVSKDMVLGKALVQIFPSLNGLLKTYAAVVDNQCPAVFEDYFKDTDRWFAIKAYPVGKERFAVLFSDITERKKADNKLRESEKEIREVKEQLELSIRAGKIGVWFWDVKKDILTWSKEQKEIYGFSASEVVSEAAQFIALIFPDDLNRIQVDQSKGKLDHEYDFRIIRKNDGEVRWIKSRARNTLDAQGALQFISGVNIDVTEQVLALNKIKESEVRFRNLAETLPQMVWVMNRDGRLEYGSKNWKVYSGIDDVGEAWHYMVHPDDRERLTASWIEAFTQEKGYQNEVRLKSKDGIYRWFYSVAEPVLDADGKVSKWVGSLTDIQDQKHIEEMLEIEVAARTKELEQKNTELQNMNKELEAFNYISSHDLQEPLRKIQIFAGRIIAKEKEQLSDTAKDYFSRIQDAATRMQDLIQDLLLFSQVSKSERKFEITGISKMVDEVKEELIEVIEAKNALIQSTELCEVNVIPF